jgi:hypothetical protein
MIFDFKNSFLYVQKAEKNQRAAPFGEQLFLDPILGMEFAVTPAKRSGAFCGRSAGWGFAPRATYFLCEQKVGKESLREKTRIRLRARRARPCS